MHRTTTFSILALLALAGAGACATSDVMDDAIATAVDTLLPTRLPADGVAAPMREAMLSTKLMTTVNEVLVQEGDRVRAGQLLVRLDARDLTAKAEQVTAPVAAAQAQQAQAAAHAARMRALFADEAAPKAMLEQAEAQLAQADAGLRAARAAGAEVNAIGSYAEIRAPFAGRVTHRFVDPGAFAAPGAPLVTVQDDAKLRLTVHVTPEAARSLRAGHSVDATIEGAPARARIEGLVPSQGNLYAVNAIVENAEGEFLAGSAAALELTGTPHRAVAIPFDAVTRMGDLTGVIVRTPGGDVRRWVRLGARSGDVVEVTSGLRAGEQVLRRSTDGSD
jgi:RND family efflux transporter MFP subunit